MAHADDLLTTSELAKRLSLTTDTIRRWTRKGIIPRHRLSRKVHRYDLPAVLAALEARQEVSRGK